MRSRKLNQQLDQNPRRAEPAWPPVMVASAHHTGMRLMRCLARRGVTVGCIDTDRTLPGFRYRYGPGYECPDSDNQPAEWLRFMVSLAAKFKTKPVLIPSGDKYVS